MILYTKKGDGGTTGTFGCDQRISKSSAITEALGTLDEANSYLGLCKLKARNAECVIDGKKVGSIIHEVQDDLFIIQAEVAGAEKTISEEKVEWLEGIIAELEEVLPEIHSFFISGGTEFSTYMDLARTLARRAERRVVAVHEEGEQKVGEYTLAYLNRLSSLLYAVARYENIRNGIVENTPDYT